MINSLTWMMTNCCDSSSVHLILDSEFLFFFLFFTSTLDVLLRILPRKRATVLILYQLRFSFAASALLISYLPLLCDHLYRLVLFAIRPSRVLHGKFWCNWISQLGSDWDMTLGSVGQISATGNLWPGYLQRLCITGIWERQLLGQLRGT